MRQHARLADPEQFISSAQGKLSRDTAGTRPSSPPARMNYQILRHQYATGAYVDGDVEFKPSITDYYN